MGAGVTYALCVSGIIVITIACFMMTYFMMTYFMMTYFLEQKLCGTTDVNVNITRCMDHSGGCHRWFCFPFGSLNT